MFTVSSRNIFVFVVLVGCLAAIYWGSQAVAADEPIEGAGSLAKAGSHGISDAPKVPKVERKQEAPAQSMTASYAVPVC